MRAAPLGHGSSRGGKALLGHGVRTNLVNTLATAAAIAATAAAVPAVAFSLADARSAATHNAAAAPIVAAVAITVTIAIVPASLGRGGRGVERSSLSGSGGPSRGPSQWITTSAPRMHRRD